MYMVETLVIQYHAFPHEHTISHVGILADAKTDQGYHSSYRQYIWSPTMNTANTQELIHEHCHAPDQLPGVYLSYAQLPELELLNVV